MTTPEEELESAIWAAMTACMVTCPQPVLFIEAITFAAQRYAAGDSPIVTALRQAVLHRDAAEHSSGSDCGGDGGAAHEPNASRSTAAGPAIAAVGGATLSTGRSVPAASKGQAKLRPQPVDKP